jgi:uncharacterized radical SAM superfamily Fe-S cluster-containing enzyme
VKKTVSICPVCLKKVQAELKIDNGKILIIKNCEDHGSFSATHWQSPSIFKFSEQFDFFKNHENLSLSKESENCPQVCDSCDDHISDTVIGVIDVTKRCDLQCSVCFSTFPEHEVGYEPSIDEIERILKFLNSRNPKPPALLFSGGEPLERDDMPEIISIAHKLHFMTILATNGVKLAKSPDLARKLKEKGLNIIYLQFDSFTDTFYEEVRGQKLLKTKFEAIRNCRKYDIEIILVNTLMRGFNDDEIGTIIKFTAQNSDIIRGIIFQPIAFTGRATGNPLSESWRDWHFAEEVETQTHRQIKATDLFPLSIMVSPIKIMKRFMKKPWPLFSCSPQCGVVNWIYVSKNGKIIPINHFVNFQKFFHNIQKTASKVESKGRMSLLSSLFFASVLSLNWPLVTKEIGFFTLMKAILKMHISPSYQSLGHLRRRIFLLGTMAFMDRYTFDVNRVKRCVVHYATPDLKIVPFCAYNNIHRIETEKEYVSKKRTAA